MKTHCKLLTALCLMLLSLSADVLAQVLSQLKLQVGNTTSAGTVVESCSEGFTITSPYVKDSQVKTSPKMSQKDRHLNGNQPTVQDSWARIMREDFETSFPNGLWRVQRNDGYTNSYWDDSSCRSYEGSKSAWACAAGQASTCGRNYYDNMYAWMIYGPFDLSDATDAYVSFQFWAKTETTHDRFGIWASTDNTNFSGWDFSGDWSSSWNQYSFDLTDVYQQGDLTGRSQVWIAFVFRSDGSINNPEGAYVDNIELWKQTRDMGPSTPYLEIASASNGQFTMGIPNGAKLLFGHPNPGTSATTIQIDGTNYWNFAGPTWGTTITKPHVEDLSNIGVWDFNGIRLTQKLTIVQGSTTGRLDVAEIRYTIQNTTSATHNVGLRLFLDTMLGNEDGAPFRVPGTGAVQNEREWLSANMPPYYEAYDDLVQPTVQSLGTLIGSNSVKPDRFCTANWVNVKSSSNTWNYAVNSGTTITNDSSVLTYWNPTSLAAGQTKEFVTYYGRSAFNLDMQPPLVSGLTADNTQAVLKPNQTPFTLTVHLGNSAPGVTQTAQNVTTTIQLPNGLTLAQGEQATHQVGNIAVNQIAQTSYNLIATGVVGGRLTYSVTISAPNIATKTVSKEVYVFGIEPNPAQASDIEPNEVINVRFNVPMNAASINSASLKMSGSNGAVTGTVTYNQSNQTATFQPTALLEASKTYSVTLTTAIQSASGVNLPYQNSWSYSVKAPENEPPYYLVTLHEALGSPTKKIKAVFDVYRGDLEHIKSDLHSLGQGVWLFPKQDFKNFIRLDFKGFELYDATDQKIGHIKCAISIAGSEFNDEPGREFFLFLHNDLPFGKRQLYPDAKDGDGWDYFDANEYQVSMLVPPKNLRENIKLVKNVALFIHGVNGNYPYWGSVPDKLNLDTYDAWQFYYPYDQRIIHSGRLLGRAIDWLLKGDVIGTQNYTSQKVSLIAHSMGGLVSRCYIQSMRDDQLGAWGGFGNDVERLLMFATPNYGSNGARRVYSGDWVDEEISEAIGKDVQAPAYKEMTPASDLLWALNSQRPIRFNSELDFEAQYLVVAGVKPIKENLSVVELDHQQDGVVAVPSASLLHHGIPLGILNLTHTEIHKDDHALQICRGFLDDGYKYEDPEFITEYATDWNNNPRTQSYWWEIPSVPPRPANQKLDGVMLWLKLKSSIEKNSKYKVSTVRTERPNRALMFNEWDDGTNWQVGITQNKQSGHFFSVNEFGYDEIGYHEDDHENKNFKAGNYDIVFAKITVDRGLLQSHVYYKPYFVSPREISIFHCKTTMDSVDFSPYAAMLLRTNARIIGDWVVQKLNGRSIYERTFTIDASIDTLAFYAAYYPDSLTQYNATMTLLTPGGAQITPNNYSGFSGTGYEKSANFDYEYYTMSFPQKGAWKMQINVNQLSGGDSLLFYTTAFLSSDISVQIESDIQSFDPGQTVNFTVKVFQPSGASLTPTAKLYYQGESTPTQWLTDLNLTQTGSGGNYKQYNGSFRADYGGQYTVHVTVDGQYSGYAVNRAEDKSFIFVGSGPVAPATPTLLAPTNNATNVAVNPTLSWTANATSYCLEVANNPNFTGPIYTSCNLTGTSQVISGLAYSTTYYWRVKAKNAAGQESGWSEMWQFTTTPGGGFNCANVTEIPQSECEALVALYTNTNGPGWTNKSGWLQTNTPCSWYGITCVGGHVSRIELSSNQLSGSIPNFNLPNLQYLYLPYNQLSGPIPNFNLLSKLQYFELYSNQLSGPIPNFNNLPNLQYLGLHSNQLSGLIPNFNLLPSLQELRLSSNQLSGPIPNFNNLPNLQSLNLGSNQLNGPIPNFNNLPNLQGLWLHKNQLSSAISNFNLPNLQLLVLSSNQLSGPIPNFSLLPNLLYLQLYSNQLSGPIPNFNLPKLVELYLYSNQLSGPIPNFNLPNLQALDLASNQLSGPIPNLNLPNLYRLDLYSNQLSGPIPNFNLLPSLQGLGLYSNQLNGPIPNFNLLPNLQRLWLSSNQLSGEVPSNITGLTNLSSSYTNIGYNRLTSTNPTVIAFLNSKDPDWAQTQTVPPTNVQAQVNARQVRLTWSPILYTGDGGTYRISYSATSGGPYALHDSTTDKTVNNYTLVNLTSGTYYFVIQTYTPAHSDQHNNLLSERSTEVVAMITGGFNCAQVTEIPQSECLELVNLYNTTNGPNWKNKTGWLQTNTPCSWYGITCVGGHVTQINLAGNQLSGSIPNFNLPNLQYLGLDSNQLSGAIPNFNLPNLASLLLYSNQLSGPIPNFDLPRLLYLYINSNRLSGSLPNFNLPNLRRLDLSSNQLSGNIPNFTLTNLENLFLNSNQLSGNIPSFYLPKLVRLDLSSNQLGGEVPTSITSLTQLAASSLDIGYNKFVSTNSAVTAFLNSKDPDWSRTQTIPPTNLKAQVGAGEVQLTWNPILYVGDDGYYQVSYATTSGGPYMLYNHTENKLANSYTFSGVPGTYYFVIETYTSSHGFQQNNLLSEKSNQASATIVPRPNPPQSINAISPSSSRVDISWTHDGQNVERFIIDRRTSNGAYATIDTVRSATARAYTDTRNLTPGITFCYQMRAYNSAAGASNSSNEDCATLLAAPSNFTIRYICSQAVLTWNSPVGVVSYQLERKIGSGGYTAITPPSGSQTSYTDNGLSIGTTYCYHLRAFSATGDQSDYTTEYCVTPLAAPANVIASKLNGSQIQVTWQDVSNETGYYIYRQLQGQSWAVHDSVNANTVSYMDSRINASATYCYRIYARAANGVSCESNPDCGGLAIEDELGALPPIVTLYQNYPNPFNPATTIVYALPQAQTVELSVYDQAGKLVRTLAAGSQPAGYHSVTWNGYNERGEEAGSGIYLYRLQTPDRVIVKKMALLR